MMAQPTIFLISIFNEGKLFLIQTTLRECVLFPEAKKMITTDSLHLYAFDMILVGY